MCIIHLRNFLSNVQFHYAINLLTQMAFESKNVSNKLYTEVILFSYNINNSLHTSEFKKKKLAHVGLHTDVLKKNAIYLCLCPDIYLVDFCQPEFLGQITSFHTDHFPASSTFYRIIKLKKIQYSAIEHFCDKLAFLPNHTKMSFTIFI